MAKAKSPAAKKPAKPAVRSRKSMLVDSGEARIDLSEEELHRLIREAAYFKAKARNFAPGHEVQDWVEAESEVKLRLNSDRPSGTSQQTSR